MIKYEFDLFGYFKNDKLRKIWFLFLSLNISRYNNIEHPFYFSIERLKYFCCTNKFFEKCEKSLNFKKLKDFSVKSTIDIPIDEILKKNNFRSLETIAVIGVKDIINEISLKGIKWFLVNQGKWLLNDTNDLKTLTLYDIQLNGYEKWGKLLNVEKLVITAVNEDLLNFFKIHKFECLKEFALNCSEINNKNTLGNVHVNWKHLEKFCLTSCDITDIFFQSNEFINLKAFWLIQLNSILGNNWKLPSDLKSFVIKNCNNFDPSFFKQKEMRNIEDVTCVICIDCEKIDENIFMESFEELKYQKIENNFSDGKVKMAKSLNDIMLFKSNLKEHELNRPKRFIFDKTIYTFYVVD